MNFSAFSIRNPVFAIMAFVLLTFGGIISFERMKVQQFPDMDFPVVVTTIVMPGASPEQLENDVAKKIEDKISGIEGGKKILTTIQSGVTTVVQEFRLGKDIQEALDDVRSAVGEIRGNLPAAAEEPVISKIGTTGLPIVTYTISNDAMDQEALSWFVDDYISKLLSGLEGVGSVGRVGGVDREVHVDVDPLALKAYGGTVAGVSDQLRAIQQDAPGGEASVGDNKQSIRALGAIKQASQLPDMQIPLGNGNILRLGQMANIKDTYAEPTSIALLNGKPVVAFEITRSRGASEVEVAGRVQQALDQLVADRPAFKIEKVYDLAKPVGDDYHASLQMLIEGAILAVIVVFAFLRNLRATIIAAVALPLSVIPTFAGMYLLDFSLNIISLLALSLVIGILVDDAIVEIENIIRHLRMGKTPYQAAMEAADEIGLAVVATTFTLIAVFLPTAFMTGVVGQFFKQFGWTASIAIFVSLLVARLLTPMMCAYLIKPEKKHPQKRSRMMDGYLRIVHYALSWRWLTLIIVVAMFTGSLFLTRYLPAGFLPPDDFSQTRVKIELAPGATIEETSEVARWTRETIEDLPSIENIYTSIGHLQGGIDPAQGGHGSVRQAALNIELIPRGERPVKTEIEQQIRERLADIPGARFKVGLSNGGEGGYKVSIYGDNYAQLRESAHKIMREIRDIPGVATVTSNEGIASQELQVIPNELAMAENGVSTEAIAHAIRVATAGEYSQRLPKLNLNTRQIPILVRLPKEARGDLAILENLNVQSSTGQPVRLGDVASLQFGSAPSGISRLDRSREITITADTADGQIGELVKQVKALPAMQSLPPGVHAADQGQADDMKELFEGFATAMGIGVISIYGVLVLLFRRWLQPFTILMALPLSLGGAFVGLMLAHAGLSMPSLIGLIMLMGIATKNSILLVDYAIIAEKSGKSRYDALIDACRKRARPIIMTTIAMGAGMVPLILGWGGADPTFRQPMAIAVFGGLITSTLLSLIVIPTFYTFMDDIARLFKRLFGSREAKPSEHTA
ncbi:efflux RND transporter permease subunit [Cardiobacteriaceae bacterium TAE3-ERU3]|nr:efflux RND transporter permease subunit [Cardiobacteriaceae bacterium TAE3-ERU3]